MRTSATLHPPDEPLIVIRKWQLEATGDTVSAALLSFFGYWHDHRIQSAGKARHFNAVAEKHGEQGMQDTSLYQYHSTEEIESALLGIGKRDSIRKGIENLQRLEFLTVHRNPNPRYKFDATRHFVYHVARVNEWIQNVKRDSSHNDVREIAERYDIPQTGSGFPSTGSEKPQSNIRDSSEIPPENPPSPQGGKGGESQPQLLVVDIKPTPPPPAKKPSKPVKPVQTDEQWLSELCADPTYEGIDVRREHGKMLRWCNAPARKRTPTRRMFINWINRVDKPMTTNGASHAPKEDCFPVCGGI